MPPSTRHGPPNIFPFLRYHDAPAAIDWLERAFGFERLMVALGPEGSVAHAQLAVGAGVIMLSSARDDDPLGLMSPRDLAGVSQGIYVHVDDVDSHHRRAVAAGAEVIHPLQDMDYGSREYAARDPEGYVWSFGTYRPGEEES